MEGGALRDGLGCGGEGGTGPTRVSYLHGAGAGAVGTVEAATAAAAATTGVLWLEGGVAVTAAVVGGATEVAAVAEGTTAVAVGSRSRLDPPIRGGEECLILGPWLCPPRVLAMPGLEKERRWRGWEEGFLDEGTEMA